MSEVTKDVNLLEDVIPASQGSLLRTHCLSKSTPTGPNLDTVLQMPAACQFYPIGPGSRAHGQIMQPLEIVEAEAVVCTQ